MPLRIGFRLLEITRNEIEQPIQGKTCSARVVRSLSATIGTVYAVHAGQLFSQSKASFVFIFVNKAMK